MELKWMKSYIEDRCTAFLKIQLDINFTRVQISVCPDRFCEKLFTELQCMTSNIEVPFSTFLKFRLDLYFASVWELLNACRWILRKVVYGASWYEFIYWSSMRYSSRRFSYNASVLAARKNQTCLSSTCSLQLSYRQGSQAWLRSGPL